MPFLNNSELRHKFIKEKYERHKFISNEPNLEKILNEFINFVKENDCKKNFESLLYIYGQNFNLMTPFDTVISYKLNNFQVQKLLVLYSQESKQKSITTLYYLFRRRCIFLSNAFYDPKQRFQ